MSNDGLRKPGSDRNYTPVHGARFDHNSKSRSCGKCGQFRPVEGRKWKRHPVLSWIADCCFTPKVEVKA